MSWRQSVEVARWEFRRFIKPKQLAVSFVLTIVAGAMGFGFARLSNREVRTVNVAVVGGEALAIRADAPFDTAAERVRLLPRDASVADSLRERVRARKLDGLVLLRGRDAAELVVTRDPVWLGELQAKLTTARQSVALRESNIDPARLAAALAPIALRTTTMTDDLGGRRARIVAVLAAGLVLYGVFTGSALMFVGVTGEKQRRVTEQLLAALSPQSWMDGKILGVAAAAVVSLSTMLLGGGLFAAGMAAARGGIDLSGFAVDPWHLALTLLYAALGYAFWLSFLAGVAATVDDPNTSTRGPIMFVPVLFSAPAFMIVKQPDSVFARVMSLLPPSAPAVMPARLAVTDVPWWEVVVSLVLLVAAVWALRRVAGRIFAVTMMLYGKEPSWREVRRLMREAA